MSCERSVLERARDALGATNQTPWETMLLALMAELVAEVESKDATLAELREVHAQSVQQSAAVYALAVVAKVYGQHVLLNGTVLAPMVRYPLCQ